MKRLLLVGIAIMLCILPVSAAYNCNLSPIGGTFTGSPTYYFPMKTDAQVKAMCGACGFSTSDLYYHGHYRTITLSGTIKDVSPNPGTNWSSTDPNLRVVGREITCGGFYNQNHDVVGWDGTCYPGATPYVMNLTYWYRSPINPSECSAGTYIEPTPDFIGSPSFGSAPLLVSFSTNNLTNTSGMSWSFGDGNITSSTLSPLAHFYQNQGIYSVRLDYFNWSGFLKSIQKNNYITVGAPNATKTKFFQTIDGTNGNIVLNSSIQLNDIENSSWVNATGLINDGMSSITTLEGHHINAYAQALGYSDADDLDILNDGLPAYIMMWPTFAKNVSAGNVSLYVTVKDKDTKANIKGAGVTISPSSGSAQSTTTNEAGIAYFVVKNSTMVLITAQAIGQGYQTATTTINTGINSGGSASAAATILLGKNTVTPTFPTVTTLPGGGTPTATVTILPGCEDQISEEGQAKCRRAQSNQGLSFLSANMGDLIMLCVFVTMMYLLGFKLGK